MECQEDASMESLTRFMSLIGMFCSDQKDQPVISIVLGTICICLALLAVWFFFVSFKVQA
jgi:hypothetical protein